MSKLSKAIALVRTCSTGQSQYESIISYAEERKIKIYKTFESKNNGSGVLKEILKYCRVNPHIEYLLISEPSRLTRSVIEYNRYKGAFSVYGVEIRSATDASGESFDYLSAALAKIYSQYRSESVGRSMLRLASRGYSVGRPPLGYTRTLTSGLYEKTNTASALRSYFEQVLSGQMTVKELRQAISRIYHPNEKQISHSKLRRIISNPYYIGFVSWHGKFHQGLHEPLLTEIEQQQLIALLDSKKRGGNPHED
ncbi:MAG: recombinase family protein [Candidatus Saccharimonadales bacterium]